jgi:hypothetical protein
MFLLQMDVAALVVMLAFSTVLLIGLPRSLARHQRLHTDILMRLSLALFLVICCAVIAEYFREGHIRSYEAVMLVGAAGIVAVRYIKRVSRRPP